MARDEAVWRALADPTRRRILDLLRRSPRTTGGLAAGFFGLSRFAVMKHLAVLEEAGLVLVRRKGRERWNYLNAVPLRRAYERWMQPYAEQAAESLLRLKETVEGTGRKGRAMERTTEAPASLATLEIEQEVEVDASRERVFEAATERVGEWFTHRMKAGAPLRFEPRVGGHSWEDWGDGKGALWSTITAYNPPSFVRFAGEWGVAGPVMIVTTFRLEERGKGTLLQMSWRIVGEIDPEGRASYESVTAASARAIKEFAESAA